MGQLMSSNLINMCDTKHPKASEELVKIGSLLTLLYRNTSEGNPIKTFQVCWTKRCWSFKMMGAGSVVGWIMAASLHLN